MRRRFARLVCRLKGHDERCQITLFITTLEAEHTHACGRCSAIRFTEIIKHPEGPDMGLATADQRAYLN